MRHRRRHELRMQPLRTIPLRHGHIRQLRTILPLWNSDPRARPTDAPPQAPVAHHPTADSTDSSTRNTLRRLLADTLPELPLHRRGTRVNHALHLSRARSRHNGTILWRTAQTGRRRRHHPRHNRRGIPCDSTVIGTGDIRGVLLVMLSSLLYAVYMVIVKVSRIALPADTLTYHVLAWGTVAIVAFSLIAPSEPLQLLHGAAQWGWAIFLALVPTVISIILTNAALRDIGPTPTAILGALEPMTAVLIGTLVFGEAFTPRLATGIAVILTAVILVVAPRPKKSTSTATPILNPEL